MAGFGVGVGVGLCVGTGVGAGVAVGLMMSAAWPDVGVGVGVEARLLLPIAEPIQEKKRTTAMSVPHPKPIFILRVLVLYHPHKPVRFLGGGKLL